MTPIVSIIKYVLLAIVFMVMIFKTWQITSKIVKKFKNKDSMDFKEEI